MHTAQTPLPVLCCPFADAKMKGKGEGADCSQPGPSSLPSTPLPGPPAHIIEVDLIGGSPWGGCGEKAGSEQGRAVLGWGKGDRAQRCPGLRKQQAQVGSSRQWALSQHRYMCHMGTRLHVAQGDAPPHLTLRRAWAALGHSRVPHPSLPRTGVVAGDAGGAAKDLPEQGGILLPVLDEDILQCLCPVQLIEDDGGCRTQRQGWVCGWRGQWSWGWAEG